MEWVKSVQALPRAGEEFDRTIDEPSDTKVPPGVGEGAMRRDLYRIVESDESDVTNSAKRRRITLVERQV